MANVPEDLQYSKDHEWIRVDGDTGTIGITDHAQNSLGDVVYVELPKPGETFAAHESFGSVESVKAVSEIFTPVSGEIVEVNESLQDEPEKVNTDPYGEGWMIRIRMKSPGEVDSLLTVAEYEDFTKGEETE
jgi:glycine cleavage system H protein